MKEFILGRKKKTQPKLEGAQATSYSPAETMVYQIDRLKEELAVALKANAELAEKLKTETSKPDGARELASGQLAALWAVARSAKKSVVLLKQYGRTFGGDDLEVQLLRLEKLTGMVLNDG